MVVGDTTIALFDVTAPILLSSTAVPYANTGVNVAEPPRVILPLLVVILAVG